MKMLGFKKEPGGQVATALVALSRWGISTAYIGKIGDDDLGQLTREALEREGVDTTGLVIAPGTSSQFAFILVDQQTGERTIVWHRPDEVNLTPSELNQELVTSGEILHLDGYEIEAALVAARWAREASMQVVVDMEEPNEGTEELISLTQVLITDQEFPYRYTGKSDPWEALQLLRQQGPGIVVMTRGKEGSVALWGDKQIETPGYPVQAIDTTGAGDLFHAGIIYGLLQGWEAPKCLSFANYVAALSCQEIGGRAGIPSISTIRAFSEPCNHSQPP